MKPGVFMRAFVITLLVLVAIQLMFFSDSKESEDNDNEVRIVSLASAEEGDSTGGQMKKGIVHSLKVNWKWGRLQDAFSDSNAVQLTAAEKIGVGPITDLRSAYNLQRPIRKVSTCDAYVVDSLTHSMPYLVPQAANLLAEIGTAFTDTIIARGGQPIRIKVTSLMRTDKTVDKLKKRNRNASNASCHRYGTTFDISYTKFISKDTAYVVSQADLKNILAEILYNKREEGKCYVKYEVKQSCFHITTR